MQHVECEICEWTDNVNIQDELWSRHTALLAFLSLFIECLWIMGRESISPETFLSRRLIEPRFKFTVNYVVELKYTIVLSNFTLLYFK